MDQEQFLKKYNGYVDQYDKESAEVERLQKKREDQKNKAEVLSAFMFELHEREGMLEAFEGKIWIATIEQVIIHHDGRMVFQFRNGTEVTR